MRAVRVTVVVPCVWVGACVCACVRACVCVCLSVCLSVHSFLPRRASRPQNIGTYMFTATGKNNYNRDFRKKSFVQKLRRHFLATDATNYT